ncbi:CHAT domain-containing tetratricopeptide repeat protein [Nostoc sp. UHCC 0251]|uniref:CHAT domain-containing protein n=1 Tax=Nostoc sp. UHCC 0251 TaxID=3110240 RepID=UPI002B1F2762|nr:CHAT domain-containing tetratricopeptide repeat protein [Nostoc sp. UHCC 0251]MEA5623071.1 CHAT domain-containing tetratricopeptide repeat protein [Nostoc sp. UHCC 0251]
MKKQRLHAYNQLIQTLLDCPSGEEPEILAANTELLDADFVQVVVAAAEHFAQQGDENTANWLRNLATYLTTPETTPITQKDIETYGQFLIEILQATAKSNGNTQVIYPLLAANTDKLNDIFAKLLRHWATNTLAEAEPDVTPSIAAVIVTFSNLIKQFPLGSKASNMEIAIAGYEIALTVYTRSAFPEKWAMTQNNLGNAYGERIFGERADNIESAIAAFSAALEVRTRSAFPEKWAGTQNNLGNAYGERIFGERAENIEFAIVAYSAALEVYTRSTFPVDWAGTQNNLGITYGERIFGERAENIEFAIAAYSAALEVYTRSAFPENWATTQNNLGNAYGEKILGERADNIEFAITAYTAALEVLTRSAFPQYHTETLLNLGRLYQDEKQFNSAYDKFVAAIKTVEALRGDIVSGEEAKRKQAEEWNQLYKRMVEVCLALARDTEAIEYIERSKTQNLVELLTKATLKNPENLPLVSSSINFGEIQNLLDNKTAIIEWYLFNDCFRAFIITCDNNPAIWHSNKQDLDALIDWTNEYLDDYNNPEDQNKIQWQNQLEERLKKLAEILHLEEILNQLPKQCDRLILIPHRYLHLFPLHALPVKESYLIDLFPNGVGYAPSCQLLQQVQLRQRPDFQSFFAIQNPTQDLYEKDLGAVAAIKKQFTDAKILKQDQANKSAILLGINENIHNVTLNEKLLKANCAFFFCHGYFNFASPQDSGLQLADGNLTLADIITHFKLENCRLVTLSACETGLTDFTSTSDEYIGLPSGFLLAGSTNVVSSLWTVDAIATALLMIKFYEELQQQSNIVLALNTAQRWLRDTTLKGFQDWLINSSLSYVCIEYLNKSFVAYHENTLTKPFESPFYWAAFCNIGKGV